MFVIASIRPWHQGMAEPRAARTGQTFAFRSDRSKLTTTHLASHGAEAIFLPHWSDLTPDDVHEMTECISIHMTDLRFGRSRSPLQTLINRGYETIMLWIEIGCIKFIEAWRVRQVIDKKNEIFDLWDRKCEIYI